MPLRVALGCMPLPCAWRVALRYMPLPWAMHGAIELRFTVVAFCTALIGGGVVVCYGRDQHLGTGWLPAPAEVCLSGAGLGLSRCLGPG